ncbi:MAG TPA: alpha/beta hydrolase [Candidatus Dormibacteraeota bacterium]|nr:alpha/beta hydrolase [Candidatus Dormibacteraeota bacterium]
MSLTTHDGRELSYRKLGHGPLLVCHPGGPGFSSTYFGDLAALWEQYTLVMVNPRGTGGSDRPNDPRAYQIEDYVADLEEVRRHLGVDRMQLLGHSHGGIVAMAYAAAHPGRVRKLVLSSTLARFGHEQERAMRIGMEKRMAQPWCADAVAALEQEQAGNFASDEELTEIVLREWPLYFAHYGPVEAGYIDTLRTETVNADALKLFNREIFTSFDLRGELSNIKSPTVVITGDEDFICGPICSEEICAGVAGARMVLVGDAGHMLFVEQPQAFHDEVAEFLAS